MNNKKKQLKIVIACDKYKDSLNAVAVCKIIEKVIKDIDRNIEVVLNPMADGGEGTVDTLVDSLGGRYINAVVAGPLGEKVRARFGLIKDNTAIIEMAAASGLWLLPEEKRNPLFTTSYGTGQLIEKALKSGAKKIIMGIGGSATNDAGTGAAKALGFKFYDKNNKMLDPVGKELENIDRIDTVSANPLLKEAEILVACDVSNPLFGPEGAAYVYGPQKGASREEVLLLDKGLKNFARVVKKDLAKDISSIKGGGAAGGMGAGAMALLNARLEPGANIVITETGLADKLKNADLVITGEGSIDNQTFFGKSAYGVAVEAKKFCIPVITINGSIHINYETLKADKEDLFSGNFSIINKIMSLKQAIGNSEELLYFSTREIIKFYLAIVNK